MTSPTSRTWTPFQPHDTEVFRRVYEGAGVGV